MRSKRFLCTSFLYVLVGILSFLAHASPVLATSEAEQKLEISKSVGKLPLYFIENQGQVDQRVKFYEKGLGHTIYFTDEGALFLFGGSKSDPNHATGVAVNPVGMRKGVEILGLDEQVGKVNYLKGDPSNHKTNIPTYQSLVYQEAYPGIDLKFYGTNRQLEYDIVVKPGGDVSKVQLRYSGIEGYEITAEGNLAVRLQDGRTLQQLKPVVYQDIDGKRVDLPGTFKIIQNASSAGTNGSIPGSFVCAFDVPGYNKNHTLIIDPVVLTYSTFVGGVENDYARGIAVDSIGSVYVTGHTESWDFPMAGLTGGFITDAIDMSDIFVFKLNPAGDTLLYATYFGGTADDFATSIAIDNTGRAYITGFTFSSPAAGFTLLGPQLLNNLLSRCNAFVTIFNAAGTALVYSTYLGSSINDNKCTYGLSIAVEFTTFIWYVTGQTDSPNFAPSTAAGYQTSLRGGTDGFVVKGNTTGTAIYSTYLGGEQDDSSNSIAVDSSGKAYVTGYTYSNQFPVISGALQSSKAMGRDAFVTKFNTTGALEFSTYMGGDGDDMGRGIALDSSGNAYVTGETTSMAIKIVPVNPGVQNYYAGETDAFVAKITVGGDHLTYFTWLGGTGYDSGYAIASDATGNVYVTGETVSTDFPLQYPYQDYNGGYTDAFVTKINSDGNAFVYSTYLGGIGDDSARAIALDFATANPQQAYVVGFTTSDDFPITRAPLQGVRGSDFAYDAFVTKMVVEAGGALQINLSPQGAIDAGAQWKVDNGAWQDSGATVTDLSVGVHMVYFKGSITGWTAPDRQTATIVKSQTTTGTGTYIQQVGSLKVTIAPQGAIDAGAQWKVDNGSWQDSGTTVPNIGVGQHTLYYKDTTGWTAPTSETVTIFKNQTTTTSGTYVQEFGSLTVNITPQEAVNAGAQWKIDSGNWTNSGITLNGVSVGQHTLSFKDTTGWTTPTPQTVTINNSLTTVASGVYLPVTGALTVTILPQEAIAAGAQWKVDSGNWQNSDVTISDLAIGPHTVIFKDVTGWTTPVQQNVTIANGQTATVTGTYVAQTGSLKVTITPAAALTAGAQWRIDNGNWQNSGTTLSGVSVGQHTLNFKDVLGWTTPVIQTVNISNGQTATATGTYVAQTGSLKVNLAPAGAVTAGAQWRMDGGAWKNSGVTLSNVSVGQHTVEFKAVTGWAPPVLQIVTVFNNNVTTITGTYTQSSATGTLQVNLAPAGAINAGAQWKVDNGAWKNSGAKVTLPAGSHTIAFKAITGWKAPANQTVTVAAGATKTVTGTYVQGTKRR